MTQVTFHKGGTDEHTLAAREIQIPDLWSLAMDLEDQGDTRRCLAVLECWYIAHDLKRHIIENE